MKIEEIEIMLRQILTEEMEEVSRKTIYRLVKEVWKENLRGSYEAVGHEADKNP